jgi:uncharacterized cupin superfamily protein
MHCVAEELFFVLSGRPLLKKQDGEEELAPGDFVFCPEGRAGLHAFFNRSDEPARILAISATPSAAAPRPGDDPGIIARFEIPIE